MAVDVASFYKRYGPMVLRRCRQLLKDEEMALDAMQDTFVKVLTYEERLDDRAPSSLLYRMATNVCLNRIRSEGRRPVSVGDDELITRIACAPSSESRTMARSILGRLFQKEKASTGTIAVLHLLDGWTLEEVAREVGLSVSGVRKRLRTLRAHVHELEGIT